MGLRHVVARSKFRWSGISRTEGSHPPSCAIYEKTPSQASAFGRINLKHLGGVLTPVGHRRVAARFKFRWSGISRTEGSHPPSCAIYEKTPSQASAFGRINLKHLGGVLTPVGHRRVAARFKFRWSGISRTEGSHPPSCAIYEKTPSQASAFGRINLKHLGGVLTPVGHRRVAARFKFRWSGISRTEGSHPPSCAIYEKTPSQAMGFFRIWCTRKDSNLRPPGS